MFTRCSFDKKENKLNYYRVKDCIEKLCKKLKERAMKIVSYEEKEMIPLIYEENKSYKEQDVPIKKECDNGKTVTHKLKFIDSFRFMSTSLSELADNLLEFFIV